MIKDLNMKGVIVMSIVIAILIFGTIFFSNSCKSVSQIIAEKDYSEIKDEYLQKLMLCIQGLRGKENATASSIICGPLSKTIADMDREEIKKARHKYCKKEYLLALEEKKKDYERATLKQEGCWKSLNEK